MAADRGTQRVTGFRSAVTIDQRLLVAGQSGFDLVSAVWDPATGRWSEPEAVPLASCEGYPEPIRAPDGRVLWWGWCNQGVALFDPASGWTNPATSGDDPIVGPMTTTGDALLGFPTTSPFGTGAKARWSRVTVTINAAG